MLRIYRCVVMGSRGFPRLASGVRLQGNVCRVQSRPARDGSTPLASRAHTPAADRLVSESVKWTVLILAGGALLAAGAAGALGEGRIVAQQGIAGVRLGMTQNEVKAKAGLPRKIERGRTDIGSYTTYRYRAYSVTFFSGRRATQVETVSPVERTRAGVGVGSTRSTVAGTVPRTRCAEENGVDHCYVGIWKPGMTVTDFSIRSGRVWRITIGYVVD